MTIPLAGYGGSPGTSRSLRRVKASIAVSRSFGAAAAMLASAVLWGVVGGRVAGLGLHGVAAAAVVELITGVALTVVACGWRPAGGRAGPAVRSSPPVLVVRTLRWRVLVLGAVEAVNVALYYQALQLAPVGPVMALHLCAPVLLAVTGVLRGRRALGLSTVVSSALTVLALSLIAADGISDGDYRQPYVGYLLALASAACLAFFVTGVGRAAPTVSPIAAAGVQMAASGLLLSPSLLDLRQHGGDLGILVAFALVALASVSDPG
jgi:drug/metabolite transporter (DMT)-like permease